MKINSLSDLVSSFILEQLKLDSQTHLETGSSGECCKHVYMTTPLSVFKEKRRYFTGKKDEDTGLKLWHADAT